MNGLGWMGTTEWGDWLQCLYQQLQPNSCLSGLWQQTTMEEAALSPQKRKHPAQSQNCQVIRKTEDEAREHIQAGQCMGETLAASVQARMPDVVCAYPLLHALDLCLRMDSTKLV